LYCNIFNQHKYAVSWHYANDVFWTQNGSPTATNIVVVLVVIKFSKY